jgi:hypothetical protein
MLLSSLVPDSLCGDLDFSFWLYTTFSFITGSDKPSSDSRASILAFLLSLVKSPATLVVVTSPLALIWSSTTPLTADKTPLNSGSSEPCDVRRLDGLLAIDANGRLKSNALLDVFSFNRSCSPSICSCLSWRSRIGTSLALRSRISASVKDLFH